MPPKDDITQADASDKNAITVEDQIPTEETLAPEWQSKARGFIEDSRAFLSLEGGTVDIRFEANAVEVVLGGTYRSCPSVSVIWESYLRPGLLAIRDDIVVRMEVERFKIPT